MTTPMVQELREAFQMIRTMALTDAGVDAALELVLDVLCRYPEGRVILQLTLADTVEREGT